MLRRACVWTVLGLLAPLAAAQDYISASELNELGLVRYWQLRLPLETDQTLNRVHLVDDQLYACTEDGYVFAVQADTGAVRWLRQISRSGYPVRRPVHAGERAIFSTPASLMVFDRLTGEGLVQRDLKYPCGTAPATDGVRVFVGGLDRRMYAHDVQTLFPVWKVGVDWPLTARPVVYNNHLFFATDRAVYGCTSVDKRLQWSTTTYGTVVADLVADENGIYVASRDQSLYLLDLAFGQIRWRARFGSPLEEAPVVTPAVAYQFSAIDGLTAVNTEAIGEQERIYWRMENGRACLTTNEKYAFILSRDERVLRVDPKTGEISGSASAPGLTIPVPAPTQDSIYLASEDGRLICARAVGSPLVRRQDVLDALRPAEAPSATEQPAEAPAAAPIPPRERELPRRGIPLGGKSKISREFESGGSSGGETPEP